MYYKGHGVKQSYKEAMEWYRRAAAQDYGGVQLGAMYEYGRGVPQSYKSAVTWRSKAADQGLHVAHFNLGVMYEKRLGLAQT